MLLFDHEWKKTLHQKAFPKLAFPNFIAQNRFEKFRLFFIQIILMSKVGKCPKHIGNEALPLLRHSGERSYGVIAVSQKYFKFF